MREGRSHPDAVLHLVVDVDCFHTFLRTPEGDRRLGLMRTHVAIQAARDLTSRCR